jgi:matrixin/ricin-type beta-trefoil lectin protein/putative peptidoglycan binding protein
MILANMAGLASFVPTEKGGGFMHEKSSRERYVEMVKQPYDIDVIRQAPDLEPGEEHPSVVEVQNFLKRFGYLDAAFAEDRTPERGHLDEVTVRALIEYQHFSHAGSGYGNLDAPTRESMALPRCGMPDVLPGGMLPGLDARWSYDCLGRAWERRFFKYAFGNVTRDVPDVVAKALVARAFGAWANSSAWNTPPARPTGLSFTRVEPSESPDFLVEWRPAADPDYSMVGNVLAHADWPPTCQFTNFPKALHFDDSEHNWTSGAKPDKFDIQSVAIHEIGHLLGLGHSSIMGSIMRPSFPPNFAQNTLGTDDVKGLHEGHYRTDGAHMRWNIRPKHVAAKCLDVTGYSQANGAKVQLWHAIYGSNQNFRPEYVGGGAYRFIAEHSGKVLEVYEGSQANGAQITQWDWHGGANQRFRVDTPVGSQYEGLQRITAVHSGKVLDVAAWATNAGAKIQQWDWVGGRNQLWDWPMWETTDYRPPA